MSVLDGQNCRTSWSQLGAPSGCSYLAKERVCLWRRKGPAYGERVGGRQPRVSKRDHVHDTLKRRLGIETFRKAMVRRSIEEAVNRVRAGRTRVG